jgi:iron complex outermembrane receptor protein
VQIRNKAIILATTALGVTLAMATPDDARAQARGAPAETTLNDVIVTARRMEERLQDVPISITVFNPQQLANNNITSAKDLATYTPSLSTNNRYGADNTTWTIRGFTQEQRTTATVGTYFADVVAPRGSGSTQGGDGAGPGMLFDLASVQVLKGPQGTLQGRNSTGGAVLLVPQKPTDKFEGYAEATGGNYGLRRFQAAVNLPLNDQFRVRAGLDTNKRDGYLKNVGLIGVGKADGGGAMGSVDYTAARFSAVAELTPALENYSIFNWSNSEATPVMPKVLQSFATSPYAVNSRNPTGVTSFGAFAAAQIAREAGAGFWSVSNPVNDALSKTKQWQFINTTTWHASDKLTVKNIISYAEIRQDLNVDLFGIYRPIVTPGTETHGSQVQSFNITHAIPGGHTNAESTFVEELQFQGKGFDDKLIWQGGLYYERSNPLGLAGIQSTTQTPCDDSNTFNCVPGQTSSSLGRLSYSWNETTFIGRAVYFQSSYDLTDKLKLTGGIRYTTDSMSSDFGVSAVRLFSAPAAGGLSNGVPYTVPAGASFFCTNDNPRSFGTIGTATNPFRPLSQLVNSCAEHRRVQTSAPTWLLDLDFKPTDNVLTYVKWSRGYRQGGVAPFAADLLQDFQKEKVNTYEIGAKTSWRGAAPGYFNIAAFYNDFTDQQLQIGLQCVPTSLCSQTTAIINAGKSELKGIELETGVRPFEGLQLSLAYAYLDTKIKAIADIRSLVTSLGLPFTDVRPLPVGSVIPNAVPHKLTASATYTLPLSDDIGRISVGATFVHQSPYRAVSDPPAGSIPSAAIGFVPSTPYAYASSFGVLPKQNLLNLNANWENAGQRPIDLGFFMTNVTNAHVLNHVNVQDGNGFLSYIVGEPRMYGFRVRYKFGS